MASVLRRAITTLASGSIAVNAEQPATLARSLMTLKLLSNFGSFLGLSGAGGPMAPIRHRQRAQQVVGLSVVSRPQAVAHGSWESRVFVMRWIGRRIQVVDGIRDC